MSWTGLLTREIEHNYSVAEKLVDQVSDGELAWKPATGSNWMTMGQLLMHVATGCGSMFKGFITGDWVIDGMDLTKLPPDAMLPPAEAMPSVESVSQAKKLLADDQKLALEMLGKTTEQDLIEKKAPAPWDPAEMMLGHRLLQTVDHLRSHKGQLFYYLKLQGKPVNTNDLWGM